MGNSCFGKEKRRQKKKKHLEGVLDAYEIQIAQTVQTVRDLEDPKHPQGPTTQTEIKRYRNQLKALEKLRLKTYIIVHHDDKFRNLPGLLKNGAAALKAYQRDVFGNTEETDQMMDTLEETVEDLIEDQEKRMDTTQRMVQVTSKMEEQEDTHEIGLDHLTDASNQRLLADAPSLPLTASHSHHSHRSSISSNRKTPDVKQLFSLEESAL